MKSGFVALIGKPNVGKSSLLNAMIGAKVSIVADKPQTTRNRITAIANSDDAQVIYIDTPGIHKPRHTLGERMVEAARGAMDEVDLILFVADATCPVRREDELIASYLREASTPSWLVINKIDAVSGDALAAAEEGLRALADFQRVHKVSAATGANLHVLAADVAAAMPEGPMYYPPDTVVDRPEEFIVSEFIREKLIELTREEIPHSVAVTVDEMSARDDRDIVDIRATVLVERESQKGIVIGAGGSVLKEVGVLARMDIEKLLGSQVNLKIWVKVRRHWRDDESMLNRLGYRE